MSNLNKYTSFIKALAFVITLIILSYLSAALAPFLSLDDLSILDGLQSSDHNYIQLFLNGGGDYYRPLTFVSFIFDHQLFGRSASAFHLVNVGIHLTNTLLVYYLSRLLFFKQNSSDCYAVLVPAILFAAHPVNVEAVMWVAGRTDLLCCLFFLLALIVVIDKQLTAVRATAALFLLTLLSLWSKEASVGLVGILFVLWFLQRKEADSGRLLWLAFSSGVATSVYLVLRSGLHRKFDTGVEKIVAAGTSLPLGSLLYDSLAAFGFYITKALYPFPLNFAIITINKPFSVIVALLALVLGCILFYRSRSSWFPLLVFFTLLVPPILALHAKLPWTPYAERYLYLPMVGFVLLVGVGAQRLPRQVSFGLLVCIMLLSIPTMQRVALWSEPMAFWQDVLKKSPEFPRSYAGVAVELLNEKKYDEAEVLYNKALKMGLDKNYVWQGLAVIKLAKGDLAGYETAMLHVIDLSPKPLMSYIGLITTLLKKTPDEETHHKVIGYYLQAQQKDPNYGDGLYNAAKEYLYLGDKQNALKYFNLFLKTPGDSMYQPFAKKMIQNIEDGDIRGRS
jgi:tetratricopeptide (TPR) repeat protein